MVDVFWVWGNNVTVLARCEDSWNIPDPIQEACEPWRHRNGIDGRTLRDLRFAATQKKPLGSDIPTRGSTSEIFPEHKGQYMKMGKLSIGVLMVFLAGPLAWTQSLATSKVSGTITDQTGAIVPDAQVQLTETNNGQVHTVKSNSAGSYIIPDLPAGPYRLEVASAGFAKYVQNGIVLNVGTNPSINVNLQVGAATQEVVVEASALMVETQSNGVGQVIDQKQVVELPLNGRDPMQLISLAGATTAAPGGDLNSNKNFPTITIAVAGGLPNGVAYILDGGSNNDPFNNLNMPMPFPDALMEFKVETSALPAQYGDHAAAAVNAVSKSGGNTFHGDAFEFVRNYMFNAANFFGYNSATGAKVRDSLKRNQFGGVFGGPIKRDKLFFFGGYQGTIVRSNPPNSFVQVPTTAMMNGDFSQIAAPVSAGGCQKTQVNLAAPFGTVNGKPNQIKPSQFNSSALAAFKFVPIATAGTDVSPSVGLPVGCGYVVAQIPSNSTQRHAIGRVDYNLTEKQRLFVRYFMGIFNAPVPAVQGNALDSNAVSQYNRDQTLTIGDTFTFSANVVNAVHLTGRRTLGLRTVAPFFDPSTLGINAFNRIPGFMGLAVTGGFSLGGGATNPGYFNSTSEQITDDVDIIRGKHEFGIGADYIYALMDTVNNRPANGTYTFTGSTLSYTLPASPSAACLANPSGLTCTAGSIGYADLLTGTLDSFSQGNPDLENDGQMYFALYAQDSWKPTKRMTVNYGVRWEPYTPEHNSNGNVENFSMADFIAGKKSTVFANAPAGMSFQGDPGYPGNHYTFGKKNIFEPRVGLVFDPMGNGKMTVRASYGMFYDSPQMFFDTRYSNSPPYGDTISQTGPISFTQPWATFAETNPFPGLNTISSTSLFPKAGIYVNTPLHVKPMYMQQWNLSLERQFGSWLFAGLPWEYDQAPCHLV